MHVEPFVFQEQVMALLRTILERTFHLETRIMTRIGDQIALNAAALQRMEVAFTGLADDINGLKFQIDALAQALASDTVSPETQQALDALTAGIASMASRMEALDAETPAVPAPEPTPTPEPTPEPAPEP